MAFPTGYTKYQEVKIDHTKVDANLTDYPIYIDLSDLDKTTDIFDTCREDGGDIRVTKADGVTQLPREVVNIDTSAKTGELHVNYIGTLSSTEDTTIRIWYNGIDTEPAADSTYGSETVWGDYALIWHGGDSVDASGNLTLTATNGLVIGGETGKFGEATNFDGVNDYLDPSNFVTDSETFYFSTWFNADTDHMGNLFSITNQFHLAYESTENIEFSFWDGDADSYLDTVSSVPNSTWHFVSAIRDKSSGMKLLLNGVSEASNAETGNPNAATQKNRIGLRSGDGEPFDGKMQELRVRKTIPSEDWITTEYANQSSPSTFYEVSKEKITAIPRSHGYIF